MKNELLWMAGALLGTVGAVGFGGFCLRWAAAGRNRWLTTSAMLLASISTFASLMGWWHLTGRGVGERSGELLAVAFLFGALCGEWSKTVLRWHLRPAAFADEVRGHMGGWAGALVVFPSLLAVEVLVAPPRAFFLTVLIAALFAVAACAAVWHGFSLLLPLPTPGSANEAAKRSRTQRLAAAIYAGGAVFLALGILLVRYIMQVFGWSAEAVAPFVGSLFFIGFLAPLSAWADTICAFSMKARGDRPAAKIP